MHTIFVCECGWIIVGKCTDYADDSVALDDAFVVRSWRNHKGVGGLTVESNRNEYNLDYLGIVRINKNKILFDIPCEW